MAVIEGAGALLLDPSVDAVLVKLVAALPTDLRAVDVRVAARAALAGDAGFHNVRLADTAVLDDDVPGPQGHSRPLLDLESRLCVLHHFFLFCYCHANRPY